MTPSKTFLYFCLFFIGGIFLNSFFKISLSALLAILILGIVLISVFWSHKKSVIIGFSILFLALGIWRHQVVLSTRPVLVDFNDKGTPITLIGIVLTEPDLREKSQKLTIKIEIIEDETTTRPPPSQPSAGPLTSRPIDGKILTTTGRYPEYQYGDKLKITGELKTPSENINDFNYKDYLKKDGIYSVMDWSKIEVIEREKYRGPTSVIYAQILKFKNKLRESIFQNLSPPQSSILGAVILGDKRKMSEDLKQKLNITGVRHITAVSGLHVTVLTTILMALLIWLGFWRQQAFYFAIVLITLFIILTGLQPSAIRAGIMGGFFLVSQYFGRMNLSSRAIVFAGAVMLAQNPLLLKLDVGFQLSFLAMLGIIYLLPIFKEWLKFIPWEGPKSILAMTLSAYLFTLPILIFNFGYVSLIGPFTNILIVPILSWIMIFGFLFAISGILWQPLGWILSLPTWLLLTYLIKIVDWFSKIPLAYKTLAIHWVWLIISYLILGFLTWRLQEKQKLKFLNY